MLRFTSNYPHTLWVAIMYYEPECEFGDWIKKGWWRLEPGQSATVYGGHLAIRNRYYCFYAQASDGARWSGPYTRFVPYQAFAWCEWLACWLSAGQCGFHAGFRLLDINSYASYYVTLIP